MTRNITERKFVMIFPVLFLALLLAGVVGIVATSLDDPKNVSSYTENTSDLSPGSFDVTTLYLNNQPVSINVHLQLESNTVGISDLIQIDMYYYKERPSLEIGNNLTALLSDNSDKLIDQDLGVSTSSQTQITGYDAIYLVIANPNSSNYDVNAGLDITITSQVTDSDQISYVLGILGAVFYSSFMLFLFVFSLVEITEPKPYQARFLTSKTEKLISSMFFNSETWEVIVFAISLVLLPLGIAMGFANVDTPITFFVVIGMIFIIYNIRKRIELYNSIRNITSTRKEIHLDELAGLVRRKKDEVRKAIFYLISHERFPLQLNSKTSVVVYTNEPGEEITPRNVNSPPSMEENEETTLVCAYCGADAIVPQAKFCSDCGASMVASK